MRVGVRMFAGTGLVSLRRVAASVYEALAGRHELVFLPHEYPYVRQEEQARMAEAFLRDCDVVAGTLDAGLLAARRRLGSSIPFLCFTYGALPGGAWPLRDSLAELTTRDVFLVSCTSDLGLAERLFRNAQARVVPFAFDSRAFHPLDEEERRAARQALGHGERDRIILYAGRITPEKNVHTLLGIFAVIARLIPDAHLVLAGQVEGGGVLPMFHVHPPRFPYTFFKLVSRLELPVRRVHLLGATDTGRMRQLYGVADVMANLTLNLDENFGLGQVEAMACGTPIVGTAWGGLKDTLADGETGWMVSTAATPTGLKASWWEALNRIVELLEDRPGRERFRETCPRHAERFSQDAFAARLDEALAAAFDSRGRPAEPLRATRFAEEFWSVCDPATLTGAPFRSGPEMEGRYRDLAAPYAGAARPHVPAGEALEPGQVLSLATPVELDGPRGPRVDHVLYPFRLDVPPAYLNGVKAILSILREAPAITAEELAGPRLDAPPGGLDALSWMLEAGLVLRTRRMPGWLSPGTVDRRLGQVLFSSRHVDRETTDLLVYQ